MSDPIDPPDPDLDDLTDDQLEEWCRRSRRSCRRWTVTDDLVVRLQATLDEREREYQRVAEELREAARSKVSIPNALYLRTSVGEGLRLVQAHRDILAMFPVSAPHLDTEGSFYGFQSRDCGEHRTVGAHRAWCYDCSEWCYPKDPCRRCHGVSEVLRVLARGHGIEDDVHDR